MASPLNTFDLQALERLFTSEHKRLCLTAYRIINDYESAEDVVQEVFIKFWNKRHELKIESSPQAYLLRSVINASLNFLESNRKYTQYREEISDKHLETLSDQGGDFLERKDLQLRLQRALDKLPPKCKTIFILSKYEGMKYQQIADHLSISIKTVENQMGIALQKLREDLKSFSPGEFLAWNLIASWALWMA